MFWGVENDYPQACPIVAACSASHQGYLLLSLAPKVNQRTPQILEPVEAARRIADLRPAIPQVVEP